MNSVNICLKELYKTYGKDTNVINGINMEIKDKEFLVLLGASGCGKSTLLRMIAGIEDVTSGEIVINGKVANNIEPKDRDIAMVFQNYALYPHMSVSDNMTFGLKIKKVPKPEIQRRVNHATAILKIEQLLKRYPSQLSGGQRQRVAIGRAIVKEPKVFLMDEPLSNLDAKLRNHMRLEIKKLHERIDCTFVYVTHDQVEAVTLGDRIAVMDGGRVVQLDTPKEIIENPINTFVAGFIGFPQINFIRGVYKIIDQNAYVFFGEIQFPIKHFFSHQVRGKEVILGIRPEHCEIATESEAHTFPMKVEICELIGTDMIVHLLYQQEPFIIKTTIDKSFKPGQMVYVRLKKDKVLLFDGETTMNLGKQS